jgi:type III pantothenate kinase
MLLTIDIGNTNTVLGVFDSDRVIEHWRIATVPDRTADELAVVLHGLLAASTAFAERDIHGISLCSTVPSVLREMREMCERYYGDLETVIVEPGVKTGVPVRTDNPKEVGSDRIMNSLAAVYLYGGPAIVVDFGTSTNFDAVSVRGEFVGGALAPGIEISVDALSRRAAQLLKVELTRPPRVIGKNTVESLQSGIVGWRASCRPMTQARSPSSPPAGWPPWSSTRSASLTLSSPGSPLSACGWSTKGTPAKPDPGAEMTPPRPPQPIRTAPA